jgi:hypothetical protein
MVKRNRIRRGWEKGICPLYKDNGDVTHILLRCPETKKWRMQFVNKKWLCINEELAYKKIVNCTNKNHNIFRKIFGQS